MPDAAEHHHARELAVLAVDAHAFFHLRGEFARRREDQRADRQPALGVAHGGLGHQPLQHRQREAGGLAGAGLCAAHQVGAGQDGGNGLRLDGSGRVVTVFMHGTHEGLDQAEVCEVHIGVRALGRAMFATCGDPLRVHQSADARDEGSSESTAAR
jgi:hypothetical protein